MYRKIISVLYHNLTDCAITSTIYRNWIRKLQQINHTHFLGMCLFGKMCRLLSRKLWVIPKVCKVMYCGSINGCLTGRDWYWTMRLLIACKKAVTRSWYKTEPPPAKQWLEIVREVFVMTYKLRLREDTFGSKWENCMRNLWLHNGLVFSYIPTYGLSFMSFLFSF